MRSRILCSIMIVCCGVLSAAGSGVHARMSMEFARVTAVLTFEQEGFMGGQGLGTLAADELTHALFLEKKYKVVDRSHVLSVQMKHQIAAPVLETADIQKLGTLLDADFIILGKITRLSDAIPTSQEGEAAKIHIAFRILSTRDAAVVGVVDYQSPCKKNIQEHVKDMIAKMAAKVDIRG
ncbi:hypothetical protein JW948_12105 [bacterium]|nr:hypothetical protein [bacterium]